MIAAKEQIHQNMVIEEKYKIGKKIGKGSFGEVFEAVNVDNNEHVAIKFEKTAITHPQLNHEYKVYRNLTGIKGIPKVMSFGTINGFNYMVMELLGASLEALLNYCKRKFSLKTALMIAIQMLQRIEHVHQMNYVHRDLKPDNFVLGSDPSNEIYLIDFGLARNFMISNKNNLMEHIPMEQRQSFTGTARYASISALKFMTQSRRDDLESIGYIMIYCMKGRLPWQNLDQKLNRKQRKEKILEIKMSTKLTNLTAGLPTEFQLYLKYCRELEFTKLPNYVYLRHLLSKLFRNRYYKEDFMYDWTIMANEEMRNAEKIE